MASSSQSWVWCNNETPVRVSQIKEDVSSDISSWVVLKSTENYNPYRSSQNAHVEGFHDVIRTLKPAGYWQHWCRLFLAPEKHKANGLNGLVTWSREELFTLTPLKCEAHNAYLSLVDDEENVVFDGSAIELVVGILCHTPHTSSKSFLTYKRFYEMLTSRMGLCGYSTTGGPGKRALVFWEEIAKHEEHLVSCWEEDNPLTYNKKPAWDVGACLPFMLHYSECASKAITHKGFLAWVSGKGGAQHWGGAHLMQHLLVGDLSYTDKKKYTDILIKHAGFDVVQEWMRGVDHNYCLRRGVLKSWLGLLQKCKLGVEDILPKDRSISSFCEDLKAKAMDISCWLPYTEQLTKDNPIVRDVIENEMACSFVLEVVSKTKRGAEKAWDNRWDEKWERLQQRNLAPSFSLSDAMDAWDEMYGQTLRETPNADRYDVFYQTVESFPKVFQSMWVKERLNKTLSEALSDKVLEDKPKTIKRKM